MGCDTWFSGSFAITPPISAALAGEMEEDYEPWLFTPDELDEPSDGVRGYEEAEENLLAAVKKITALGHTLTGEMTWTCDCDGYEFGKFQMSGNKLYHCADLQEYGEPRLCEGEEGSTA